VADAANIDNQRETALQAYLDKMSELRLHENLRESKPDGEVRNIARIWTLAVLRGLDPMRKRSVLQILYESNLIENGHRIVDLSDADLSNIDLISLDLRGAKLSKVNLREAKLPYVKLEEFDLILTDSTAANVLKADLNGANLEKAMLIGIDLSFADLNGAKLQGTILKRTNLKGTIVTSKQLDEAIFFEGVTMPNGSRHP
jgi:uncharacterized protein YjbI with pentapeptide repeats